MSEPLFDRIKAALFDLVDARTSRFDYGALYAATVKSQAADGSVGITFDDPRFPPADGIPLRLGLPGVTVKVSAGARVLVGFENQDPSRPRATLWEVSGLLELHVDPSVVTVFNGGTANVGRVGDTVRVTLTAAEVAHILSAGSGSPCTLDPSTILAGGLQVTGTITSGTTKVKA